MGPDLLELAKHLIFQFEGWRISAGVFSNFDSQIVRLTLVLYFNLIEPAWDSRQVVWVGRGKGNDAGNVGCVGELNLVSAHEILGGNGNLSAIDGFAVFDKLDAGGLKSKARFFPNANPIGNFR